MSTEDFAVQEPNPSTEFAGTDARLELFRRHRWLPLVLPLAVFLLTGLGEPASQPVAPPAQETSQGQESAAEIRQPPASGQASTVGYPLVYTFRVFVTLAAIFLVLPYYRTVPFRCSWWAIPAGLLGGFLWVGICRLRIAESLLATLGLSDWMDLGARAGFNPWQGLGGSTIAVFAFLVVRFCGLVLVVPLIEEFFLRGFLMRFFERADWWTVPLGKVTLAGSLVVTAYAVLSHPAEPLAAAVWFSLVTLLYARSRNIWDCVLLHAATNLTLGIYVLVAQDWRLW